MTLKETVIELADKIGIDKIGFTTAEPFLEHEERLREAKEKGYSTGFEHPVIEERIYPELIFEGPKSIISVALAYPTTLKNQYPRSAMPRRGFFSRSSWGIDYHEILKNKMQELIEAIKEIEPDASFKPMVDTGELMDVAVAQRAGIGFVGRNGLLITEEFGSFVYLGEIVTDLEFEPDEPVPFGCGDCYRCIRSCPPQALNEDGSMNARRCLSYQTQTKGYMDEEFRGMIGNTIYGCDICQLTCPYNQGVDFHLHEEMEADSEIVQPELVPFLSISNREFKQKYGNIAGAWRGKRTLQRNAIIALANFRDQTALPQLIEIMENDPRPLIRGTAAWAISKIQRYNNPVLTECVRKQLAKEDDPETINEMQKAVEELENKRLPKDDRRKEGKIDD